MTYYMVLPESLKLRDFQFEVGKRYNQKGFIGAPVKTPGFYLYKDAFIFKGLQQAYYEKSYGTVVIAPVEIDRTCQLVHMPDGSLKAECVTIGPPIKPADLLNRESPEFIEKAIKLWPSSVYPWLTTEKRTSTISLAAVTEDGRLLKQVPEEIKTSDLCLAALTGWKDNGEHKSWTLLEHVPDRFKTAEFFIQLLSHSKFSYDRNFVILPSVFDHYTVKIIDLIPGHIKTPAFLLDAVKHNGTVFWILNEEQRSSEIYLEAYKQGVIRFCCASYIETYYTNQHKLLCALVSSWSWW